MKKRVGGCQFAVGSKRHDISLVDAFHAHVSGLNAEQRRRVSEAVGIPVPSLYQLGQRKPDGTPRMRFRPAEQVLEFCVATQCVTVLDVLRELAINAIRRGKQMELRARVTEFDVISEGLDIPKAINEALRDGEIDDREFEGIVQDAREAVIAAARFRQDQGKSGRAMVRCGTLAETAAV